jgi:diacylglycerol kinase (ATP)
MDYKKIAFILNGTKKQAVRAIRDITQVFANEEREVFITQFKGHATELTARAVENGYRFIIGVGGDGTLNEILNGIAEGMQNIPALCADELFVGMLPTGSGNDFVRGIQSPQNLYNLKLSIDNNRFRTIDIGLAEFCSLDGKPLQRYFVNISDIGIGGIVAEKLNRYSRWMGPNLTYQRAILSTLMTYKCQPVFTQMDEFQWESKIMSLVIANNKYFGNGLGIAPFAEVSDGFFDIVILKNISVLDYIGQLRTVKKCLQIQHPEVSYAKAKRIAIETQGKPLPIDMDGEFVGYTPVKFSVIPQCINFLV